MNFLCPVGWAYDAWNFLEEGMDLGSPCSLPEQCVDLSGRLVLADVLLRTWGWRGDAFVASP